MNRTPLLARLAFALFALCAGSGAHASEASTKLAAEAKEVIDSYYGRTQFLQNAALMLESALKEDEKDAKVWVEIARVITKGGRVTGQHPLPDRWANYVTAVDRALSLDPSNLKAHVLKAEYFNERGDRKSELAELEKARAIKANDPWLLCGYAMYYRSIDEPRKSHEYYMQVAELGPGTTLEHRNAYVAAVGAMAGFASANNAPTALKWAAEKVREHRHPDDAWALGNLSEDFFGMARFDESIELNRQALAVMNYGAARLMLSLALYGKAADLEMKGDQARAGKLVEEARQYGFDRDTVLRKFAEWEDLWSHYKPILLRIVR